MTTSSLTPTYDILRESGMAREHNKAITAGQRAGERAAQNVWKPYEYEPYGSYDSGAISVRAQAAAKVASAAARERYARKVLGR